jgi:CRISPR-associated protein Csd1
MPPLFPAEMRDGNIVFRVGDELGYLHDRPAAKNIWGQIISSGSKERAVCLVTGEEAPLARLHPSIKGVWGAQTAGASIVSFNLDAFTSYGHEQGENAPVSEAAAFAYTTALNRLLAPGSRHRVQIGDTSTVFWAEAEEAELGELAEACFGAALGLEIDKEMEASKVRPILQAISKGRPLADFNPALAKGVKFYVLGLSPNASRLSIRLWLEDDFGTFADRLAEHRRDMEIAPPAREETPTIRNLLLETAVQRKYENVPPQLAGQLLRAVLAGGRYPATLLATLLMRLRADGDIRDLRVAMLKAIVVRDRRLARGPASISNPREENLFVSYDPDCREPGYLLGQLFAVYEYAQTAALGRGVNATVKDKFYGSASTTPESVFPLLDRGSVPHLAKLRKVRPRQAVNIEKQIAEIMERLSPSRTAFPKSLPPAQQALFALGYYHERNRRFAAKPELAVEEEEAA